MSSEQPSLFGLNKTNRDYTKETTWGKNQFNSSFPASLCCYLASKDIEANYLSIQDGQFQPTTIAIKDVFDIEADDSDLYFAFESQHTPFQRYVIGSLPRTDLVTQKESTGECLQGLEIKLTALPDNSTFHLEENEYGSELVVRPDTIVYLACSLASSLQSDLIELIPNIQIEDWADASLVLPHIKTIIETIKNISLHIEDSQNAFLLQPIWKTKGKSPQLAEQCLDIFVWSNAGFSNFISQIADDNPSSIRITRQTRTAIWLFKMLQDIAIKGQFNHEEIIDNLSYNTKNDKAFASSGKITNRYMLSPRLEKPVISKAEIKNIILGGGQNMLSPERRFDAIIFNSPELFL
ncbi:MAG: HindVP family restriction endonuclease [Sulfurovum sp.]|nr:HindVP family restriction endonuclease [Sulfurovaceae bacterium]